MQKRYLKIFHLWGGLTLGLLLSVSGLSGTLLMYKDQILALQYPHLSPPLSAEAPDDSRIATTLEKVIENYADNELVMVHLPGGSNHYFKVWLKHLDDYQLDYVEANTGKKLISRNPDNDFILWLYNLHAELLSGEKGELFLGLMSFLFVTLIITGYIIWWPGIRRFARSLKLPKRLQLTPLLLWFHRMLGVILAPFLLITIITAIGLVFYKPTQSILISILNETRSSVPPSSVFCPNTHNQYSIEEQLAVVRQTLPDARLIRFHPVNGPHKPVRYRMKFEQEWHQNGRSYVYLNPCTNQVVYSIDDRTSLKGIQISNMLFPIHSVYVGGSVYHGVMTVAGLSPLFLLISGLLTWRIKKKKRITVANNR